jgi:hypothetical protein
MYERSFLTLLKAICGFQRINITGIFLDKFVDNIRLSTVSGIRPDIQQVISGIRQDTGYKKRRPPLQPVILKKAGLWIRIRIRIRIGSGFNDFVDPDPGARK